jgi:hypothetical protein
MRSNSIGWPRRVKVSGIAERIKMLYRSVPEKTRRFREAVQGQPGEQNQPSSLRGGCPGWQPLGAGLGRREVQREWNRLTPPAVRRRVLSVPDWPAD